MADIFLSHSTEDRERIAVLAARLEAEGWTVFWSPAIGPGTSWRRKLAHELDEAKCVVVAWSEASIDSEWVHEEAEEGKRRAVLVPVRIDAVTPPLGFRGIQTADLTQWIADEGAGELPQLFRQIAERAGEPIAVELSVRDLSAVVVWPKVYKQVGATVNMTVEHRNPSSRAVTIRYMVARASGPDGVEYRMPWNLFFRTATSRLGSDVHVRDDGRVAHLDLAAGSAGASGVQFQGTLHDSNVRWPAGDYAFEILGWADCDPDEDRPNVRCAFSAYLGAGAARDITRWVTCDDALWESIRDDAVGIPFELSGP